MAQYDRKTVREQIGLAIGANLLAGPVGQFFDHQPYEFEQSPTVFIASTGGTSERFSQQGYLRRYSFDIGIFVYREEEAADDVRDLVFDAILDEIESLGETVYWSSVKVDNTETSSEFIGGEQHLIELVPIIVTAK